jgi:hypothetical protein
MQGYCLEGFKAWEELAEENGKREHMNPYMAMFIIIILKKRYPPLYPQAKGGNKFRFF